MTNVVPGVKGFCPIPAEQRFWSKVDKSGECWVWTGSKRGHGYGQFWLNGKQEAAHRVSYVWSGQELVAGLDLDHLCRNKSCVNPAHLEAVTHQENMMRGPRERYGAKRHNTHCPQGHEFSDENTYMFRGKRHCRACRKVQQVRFLGRRRAALAPHPKGME